MPEYCFDIRNDGFAALKFIPLTGAHSFKPFRLAGQGHGVTSYSLCHSKSLARKFILITGFLHVVLLFIIVLLVAQNMCVSFELKRKHHQKYRTHQNKQNWGAASGKNYTKGSSLWVSFATSNILINMLNFNDKHFTPIPVKGHLFYVFQNSPWFMGYLLWANGVILLPRHFTPWNTLPKLL